VNPLILTVAIDNTAFEYFNHLRSKYFPASRNYLAAHLTLFHALPSDTGIINTVGTVCQQQPVFKMVVAKPVSIGRGVAFFLESEELLHFHKNLQHRWLDFLTPQDRQKLWPHITVQNKVTRPEAQSLLSTLKEDFMPFSIGATGLQLWEYLNGPWKFIDEFRFRE